MHLLGNVLRRHLRPTLARLGLPRCGFHAFRHANATLMDRMRVPLRVRQQRLGHADPRMTLGVYTHAASQDERLFVEELGGFLSQSVPAPAIQPELTR